MSNEDSKPTCLTSCSFEEELAEFVYPLPTLKARIRELLKLEVPPEQIKSLAALKSGASDLADNDNESGIDYTTVYAIEVIYLSSVGIKVFLRNDVLRLPSPSGDVHSIAAASCYHDVEALKSYLERRKPSNHG